MRRARSAAVAAICLVVMVGTAACTHAVAPKTWASDVCSALSPWRTQIGSLNTNAQQAMATATTAAQTQAHMIDLLDGARNATDSAVSAVQKAGVPDVDGGAVIEKRFLESLYKISAAYAHASNTIKQLTIADSDTFYNGVASAMTTLNTEYSQSGIDTDQLVSAELQADFDTVSGCR